MSKTGSLVLLEDTEAVAHESVLKQTIDWRFDSDVRYMTESDDCIAKAEIMATTNDVQFSEKEADRVKVLPFRNVSVANARKHDNEVFSDVVKEIDMVKPTEFTIGTMGEYFRY